jgi:hypothetical protein
MEMYLDGKTLYGDDFDSLQIADWFADEKEGYADLGAKDVAPDSYGYHALNQFHGFSYLPDRDFKTVLGFGSAFGEELLPIKSKIQAATIVGPLPASGLTKYRRQVRRLKLWHLIARLKLRLAA